MEQRRCSVGGKQRSGCAQVEESRGAAALRQPGRGAAARSRESEDFLTVMALWQPGRASVGCSCSSLLGLDGLSPKKIFFRLASGPPPLLGRVGCYGIALLFLLESLFVHIYWAGVLFAKMYSRDASPPVAAAGGGGGGVADASGSAAHVPDGEPFERQHLHRRWTATMVAQAQGHRRDDP